MNTNSIAEVVAMFGGGSEWWLREGMRNGRFAFLQVGKERRFTEAHVAEIAKALETRVTPAKSSGADVSVLGASARSVSRHRNRAAS